MALISGVWLAGEGRLHVLCDWVSDIHVNWRISFLR